LLCRWNQTHNLTRIVDPAEAAVAHYLDCALPLLHGPAPDSGFVDVGSGAGFPGLVAALLRPTEPVVLVEPARKRASFLAIAAHTLGLRNVSVTSPPALKGHPWVLSRATFSKDARQQLWPYVLHGGQLWAWTTAAERTTWEHLVSTWPDATLRWHSYSLPARGERWIAILRRSPA
jgi:16S rRNA (guanine(527)-N(7))-methyltransferase RsmG